MLIEATLSDVIDGADVQFYTAERATKTRIFEIQHAFCIYNITTGIAHDETLIKLVVLILMFLVNLRLTDAARQFASIAHSILRYRWDIPSGLAQVIDSVLTTFSKLKYQIEWLPNTSKLVEELFGPY